MRVEDYREVGRLLEKREELRLVLGLEHGLPKQSLFVSAKGSNQLFYFDGEESDLAYKVLMRKLREIDTELTTLGVTLSDSSGEGSCARTAAAIADGAVA